MKKSFAMSDYNCYMRVLHSPNKPRGVYSKGKVTGILEINKWKFSNIKKCLAIEILITLKILGLSFNNKILSHTMHTHKSPPYKNAIFIFAFWAWFI